MRDGNARTLLLAFQLLYFALGVSQALVPDGHPSGRAVTEGNAEHEHGEGKSDKGEVEGSNVTVAIVTITALVVVSILFETFTEVLKETTDEMNMPFINTIFSELTTLGFIGLLLFVITKTDLLGAISARYLGEPKELQEMIEILHMGLFLFIVIFLVLCCGVLRLGMRGQNEWREFERNSADIPAAVSEYVLITEPPRSWQEKLSLSRWLSARKARREMIYLSIRRRFIDYRSNHPDPETALQLAKEFQRNPDVRFPFNEYLTIISGEVMGKLIEIDMATWLALEAVLVVMVLLCWWVGPHGEIYVLLFSGFALVLLNRLIHRQIQQMRELITPQRLLKDAERLRLKNEWRSKYDLPLHEVNERTHMLESADSHDADFGPPYLDLLPNAGVDMSELDLRRAQKSLLVGRRNGVKLALFLTRLIFLLTAMHLSIFLMRVSTLVYSLYSNVFVVLLLEILFFLPSVLVTLMAVDIARDGLYCFNVEHLKASRVIAQVMRILKARQTLRTLRFVAEMKIRLRRKAHRLSMKPLADSAVTASSRFSKLATSASQRGRKGSKKQGLSISTNDASSRDVSASLSPPISPLSAYLSPRRNRTEAQKAEQERREINSIFCLFDVDASGFISRDELLSLLNAITHELDESQLDNLMQELLAGSESEEEISFEAFYQWCHKHIHDNQHSKETLIEEIFRMVDTDDSGFITVDEFIAIFKTLGQSLDHDDVRELVYQMDRNNDGKIDLEEFSKMLRKHEV